MERALRATPQRLGPRARIPQIHVFVGFGRILSLLAIQACWRHPEGHSSYYTKFQPERLLPDPVRAGFDVFWPLLVWRDRYWYGVIVIGLGEAFRV